MPKPGRKSSPKGKPSSSKSKPSGKKGGKTEGLKSLKGKLGKALAEAHEEHKDDETVVRVGGSLPSGMRGTAQLTECKFGLYETGDNKGQPFFYAHGVVVFPKTYNGQKVEGLLTKIGPEPLCDTKSNSDKGRKTLSEHAGWMYNELRKLGVDTADIEPEDLEDIAATLKEEKPFFDFNTWGGPTKKYPNSQVKSEWEGINEDFVAEDTDDVEEEEEEEDDDE